MELNFTKEFINKSFLKALNDSLEFGSDPFDKAKILFRPDGQLEVRIAQKSDEFEDIHVFTEGLNGAPLVFDDEFTAPEKPENCPLVVRFSLKKLRFIKNGTGKFGRAL
jgi:hypothetical protein